jgi:2-polyprenyl-6-methoxyphenol hydroxylase-like FAD-dependent oxidoreductase
MQTSAGTKAIIIGGGIGGLTAGIALQRVGFNVTVLERAEELREVGSGLPLWTNALRALQKLGLTEALESIGTSVSAGCVSTWRGDILADMSAEELLKRLGTISSVVHRAELHVVLLKAFGAEKVELGVTCTGVTQDKGQVCALLADGREVCGDVLIGADGLHSVIRAQLFNENKPEYVGYTCWRGVADIDGTGLETWAWGKGYQFGITPMTNGRAYWFAQRYVPEGSEDKPCGRKCELLELFHDWHDPIPRVIQATAEAHILRNDVYEHKHLRHWSRGRVTLLGDAAHAMTPNLGQGACQAIEDAVVLADCLEAERDIVAALKLYETRRVKRANSIGQLAGIIGRVVQWENPLASSVRNAIMKRVPESLLLHQLMWILAYEA